MTSNRTARGFTSHLETLFGAGTCVGLSDGQLLARFIADGEEAGELAFEALVTRHGPMIMRVCQNVLDDPQDVHDAFQAVFLVLARRAGAIRNVESVGGWLHGVAMRVTARVRLGAIRRGIRDRRTIEVAETLAVAGLARNGELGAEREEGAEVVHQEVSRLPDKYRASDCPLLPGGPHSRRGRRPFELAGGNGPQQACTRRDTLRHRLTRRGVTSPAALGPLSGWLAGEPLAPSASVAAISSELVVSITKAVSQLSVGRTVASVAGGSPSLLIAQGVLKTMMLKKLIVAICAVLPLGTIVFGGGLVLVRKSRRRIISHPRLNRSKKQTRTYKQKSRSTLLKSTQWSRSCWKPLVNTSKLRQRIMRRGELLWTASSTHAGNLSLPS